MAKKHIEEIEQMMDEAIDRSEQQGSKKSRHMLSKHTDSRVRLRLSTIEVDDADSDRMVEGLRDSTKH